MVRENIDMKLKKIGIALLWAMLISGCAMKEAAPLERYTLQRVEVKQDHYSPYSKKVLKVAYPQTLKERMSTKMHFSYSSIEQGVYQNSEWTNVLPKLLQGVVISALQQSGLFRAVVSTSSTLNGDMKLESMIYDFSHHVRGKASYAVVSIRFSLIEVSSGKLLKNKVFSYREETPTVDAKGYVTATNTIMERVVKDLIVWLRG
jgi:cholesterol transport system auxiliary component